jgi:hypothetical protein
MAANSVASALEPYEQTILMATPWDGSGAVVPLVLYPPQLRDTNRLYIFETNITVWASPTSVANTLVSELTTDSGDDLQVQPYASGPTTPSSGFYRVFHIPDWAFTVTNYTYDGPTFFPVDFADYMDRVENITVLLNGQPTSVAAFTSYVYSNGQTNWGMGIYFDMLTNGIYQIQLVSTLRLGDEISETTPYLTLTNLSRSIIVNNQVTFTTWNEFILTSPPYTCKAQLQNHDTDWEIDIFDAWGNYVNTGSGHTYDGQVSWDWDLTDYNGNSRDDSDSDPYFYTQITFYPAITSNYAVTPNGSSPPTTRRAPPVAAQYPNKGGWIITYNDRQLVDVPAQYSGADGYYQNTINELVGGPALKGDAVNKIALKFGTNVYSQADRDASWANLKAYMFQPSVRNLYYYGHGSGTIIGSDVHTVDASNNITGGMNFRGSKAFLTSKIVRDEITFNKYSGPRPYRFVFLDGCSTATGDWPNAFGVGKTSYTDTSWYTSTNNTRHVRPSAFVGWNKTIGGEGWGTAKGFWLFREYWMGFWANTIVEPLHEALDDGITYSSWVGSSQFWSSIEVYGLTTMNIEDFNHKGDWSWP